MRKLALIVSLAILASKSLAAAEVEQRIIKTDTGELSLAVPKGWLAIERCQSSHGVPYYRLAPANTNFYFSFYFNDPGQTRTNALVDSGLERFLESKLSVIARDSVEGKVQPHRFGARKDGVYVRLTDRTSKPGEYLYFTGGVRLIGTNVLAFSLLSNDRDFSALSNTLAIVESAKVGGSGNERKN